MLTGSSIPIHNDQYGNVDGYQIPGAEAYEYGGGYKRKRKGNPNPFRYTIPGFSDGAHKVKKKHKKRKPSYAEYTPEAQAQLRDFNFRERDLLEDPHIDKKRALDLDKEISQRQRLAEEKEPFMATPKKIFLITQT